MNFTYRQSEMADFPLLIDFINYVFSHSHYPHDFKKMVPKVYGDNPRENAIHFIAFNESGQIIGVVGLLPLNFHIDDTILKCGFIGSVCVHPYYRSQGHMKKLMNMADDYLKANCFDLGILDGLRQRYEYYGYQKSGIHLSFEVNSDNIRHGLKDISIRDFHLIEITHNDDSSLDYIFDLSSCSPVFVERNRDTLLYTMKNFESRLYVVTYQNKFIGYFTASKNNSISEINMLKKEYFFNVIKLWMHFSNASCINITIQPFQTDFIDALNFFSEDRTIQYGANFKIFHQEKVSNAIQKYNKYLPDGMANFFPIPFSINMADTF